MSISFQGIGQVCATFLRGTVAEGQPVKISGAGTVAACGAGDDFCGVAVCKKDDACAVQVAGVVTMGYSGTAPTLGWTALAADGSGGVKTVSTGGRTYLAVDTDTTNKTVTILL